VGASARTDGWERGAGHIALPRGSQGHFPEAGSGHRLVRKSGDPEPEVGPRLQATRPRTHKRTQPRVEAGMKTTFILPRRNAVWGEGGAGLQDMLAVPCGKVWEAVHRRTCYS
jgi:hypothetical protein